MGANSPYLQIDLNTCLMTQIFIFLNEMDINNRLLNIKKRIKCKKNKKRLFCMGCKYA